MFDVRTAFLIWGVQSLTLGVLLLTVWLHERRRSYYLFFAFGVGLQGASILLFGIRHDLPFTMPPYAVTVLTMLGFAGWITGLRRLDGRKASLIALTPFVAWIIALALPLSDGSTAGRILVHQFPSFTGFVTMACTVLNSRFSTSSYRRLLSSLWFIQAANNAVTGIYTLQLEPRDISELRFLPYLGLIGIACLLAAIVLLVKIIMDSNEASLRQQALTDPLTGALNRRGLIESLPRVLTECGKSRQIALLIFDLDYFKHVNDNFGHQAGDAVLTCFATMARGVIGKRGLLARSGGEEFSALLPVSDLREAAFFAEQIRQMIAITPVATQRGIVRLTVSAGVCASNCDSFDFDRIMSRADSALYTAKAEGRNRVAVAKENSLFCLTPSEESGTPAAIDNEADRQVAALRRLSKKRPQAPA
ncbi:GGDEF domain-containing protein [Allorhizobium undicola]|uniref:GGDEF domain-containing protein n=1 Tax=Allorhizobium undicola TaxID=78527 RepID=UPI003D3261BE